MNIETFPVESDIPVPPRRGGRPKQGLSSLKYPFAKMKVNDSFAVPAIGTRGVKRSAGAQTQQRMAAAIKYYRTRFAPNAQFVTRSTPDGKFVRVWRVK